MPADALFPALAVTALTVGVLHALAPDHWVPFAALARARGWTPGLLALLFGVSLLEAFGRRLESISGLSVWLDGQEPCR